MKVLNGTGSQYPPPVTGLQLDIVALVTTLIPGPVVPPPHTHLCQLQVPGFIWQIKHAMGQWDIWEGSITLSY